MTIEELQGINALTTRREAMIKEKRGIEAEINLLRKAVRKRPPELALRVGVLDKEIKTITDQIKLRTKHASVTRHAKHAHRVAREQEARRARLIDTFIDVLVPCAHCGSEAVMNSKKGQLGGNEVDLWYGMCTDMYCGSAQRPFPNRNQATKMWNRRLLVLRAVQPVNS